MRLDVLRGVTAAQFALQQRVERAQDAQRQHGAEVVLYKCNECDAVFDATSAVPEALEENDDGYTLDPLNGSACPRCEDDTPCQGKLGRLSQRRVAARVRRCGDLDCAAVGLDTPEFAVVTVSLHDLPRRTIAAAIHRCRVCGNVDVEEITA